MTSEPKANAFPRLPSDLTWFGSEKARLFQAYLFNMLHKRTSVQIYNRHRLNDPRLLALEAVPNLCLSSLEMGGGGGEKVKTHRDTYMEGSGTL